MSPAAAAAPCALASSRQHAHLLVAQPGNLALEGDQVLLRVLGFAVSSASSSVRRATSVASPSRRPISASASVVVVVIDGGIELLRGSAQLARS